eukprot:Nk52_evm1s296 gene=Nk52_evmTU1s296
MAATDTPNTRRQRLQEELTDVPEKYKEKGYGLFFAFIIFITFFVVTPIYVKNHLWSRILSLGTEQQLYVWGSFALHEGVFIVLNVVMAIIYYVELPFFEKYKIQMKDWPWKRGPNERARWFSLVRKSIATVTINHLCLSLPSLYLSYDNVHNWNLMKFDLESFPEWYTVAFQITCFMIIEDTLFYWGHRTLHHKSIYAYIHKVHHTYNCTIGIASEYAHPFEFVVANLIPFTAGPLLFRAHLFTFWMWFILRIGETIDGHCGYEFTWSPYRLLPFSGSASHHDFHHSHNRGNFASFFTWWDIMMGTDETYCAFVAKQKALSNGKKAN